MVLVGESSWTSFLTLSDGQWWQACLCSMSLCMCAACDDDAVSFSLQVFKLHISRGSFTFMLLYTQSIFMESKQTIRSKVQPGHQPQTFITCLTLYCTTLPKHHFAYLQADVRIEYKYKGHNFCSFFYNYRNIIFSIKIVNTQLQIFSFLWLDGNNIIEFSTIVNWAELFHFVCEDITVNIIL